MKKICIVTPDIIGPVTNGGVGTACFWQARTYCDAGHDVTVLFSGQTHIESGLFWETNYRDQYGITYVDLGAYVEKHLPGVLEKVFWPNLEALRSAYYVLEFLKRQKTYDFIFFQDYLGHGLRALQYKVCGLGLLDTTCVVTLHSSQRWIREGMECVPHTKEEAMLDFLEQESARLADYTIAPSGHMAEWAYENMKLPVKPEKIPYCFECSPTTGVCKTFKSFRHLIFFGRLETRKGLHLFLEALPALLDANLVERVTFLGKAAQVNGESSRVLIANLFSRYSHVQSAILDIFSSDEAWRYIESQDDVLVVAPSIFDNLPLAVIELYVRRVPFVTTAIGGIPEIVGHNPKMMCEATGSSLGKTLREILVRQELTIDYRSGYSPDSAAGCNLAFLDNGVVRAEPESVEDSRAIAISIIIPHYNCPNLLRRALSSIEKQEGAPTFEVIICDDGSDVELLEQYRSLKLEFGQFQFLEMAQNKGPSAARNFAVKQANGDLLLFFDADNEAKSHMVRTFYEALLSSRYDCLTCFNDTVYAEEGNWIESLAATPSTQLYNPLGAALEAGIMLNVFGDTCSIVKKSVYGQLGGFKEDCSVEDWVFFATLELSGFSLGTIPESLFYYQLHQGGNFHSSTLYTKCQDILDCYAQPQAVEKVDWKFVLSWLYGKEDRILRHHSERSEEESSYYLFSNMEESQLQDYLEANVESKDLTVLDADLAVAHKKIAQKLSHVESGRQRIFIYGAGLHTKALLGSFPALYDKVSAFIDRSAGQVFLGKKILSPSDYVHKEDDVIIYSSKSSENHMYERMKHLNVNHVLLYHE
jgi:glycosyltransferase involved in cell wall biosynthesis